MAAPTNRDTLFESAVEKVLRSWTVLELAASHGFGGAYAKEKAEWMVYAICQWFKENEGIEPYELEDFLAEVFNNEFDTIVEDGSLPQISTLICKFYNMCQTGREAEVMEKLQILPKPQLQQCVSGLTGDEANGDDGDSEDNGNEEGNKEEDIEAVGAALCNGDLNLSEEAGTCHPPVTSQTPHDNTANVEENMDTENSEVTEADDGWTVVKRGKKR